MKCKYIGDSCCEFPEEFSSTHECVRVPLTLYVGEDIFIDDDSFDQALFLKKVAEYPGYPRSSCPSPEQYMLEFEGEADVIFVSTLSAALSGSYNSAVLAKKLYDEEHPGHEKKIHVFNSCSASGGECQVLMKAADMMEAGKSFEETVDFLDKFAWDDLKTFFVLESLDALRKNGRLSRMKALAATALNIKPICSAEHGVIIQIGLARGMKRALEKMVDMSLHTMKDVSERTLFITHCNRPERAEEVLAAYLSRAKFARHFVLNQGGLSSLYASDGGIIVTI